MTIQDEVNKLLESQIQTWSLAANNYKGLEKVKTKTLNLPGGSSVKIQFNPERIRSTSAKVDKTSIEERPCFLCDKNRPKEQNGIKFGDFNILVNPFPIFPKHLTIVHDEHRKQEIKSFFKSMLDLSKTLPYYTVFYNGPKCGASAPDHFHFQAGNKGFLPIEKDYKTGKYLKLIAEHSDYRAFTWIKYQRGIISLEAKSELALLKLFEKIYQVLEDKFNSEPEPMLNVLSYYSNEKYIVHILPRQLHRPDCYFKQGNEQILLSPASVDLGGVMITPREDDFNKITVDNIVSILNQVCTSDEIAYELAKNTFI